MTTANKIRYFREKKRLSQEELAYLVGVSQVTIGNWEQGKSIKHEYIKKLADALGLSTNFLLEDAENKLEEFENQLKHQNHLFDDLNKKMDLLLNRYIKLK